MLYLKYLEENELKSGGQQPNRLRDTDWKSNNIQHVLYLFFQTFRDELSYLLK